jgi:hypothetical protein
MIRYADSPPVRKNFYILRFEHYGDVYNSTNTVRVIKLRRLRWTGHVAHVGEMKNAYKILVGEPQGKISLAKPRRRWECNIKMGLSNIGWGDVDWFLSSLDSNQWRYLVNMVVTVNFSRRTLVHEVNFNLQKCLNCRTFPSNSNETRVQ